VNGPGEALYTDIGFTGGGKGAGMVYMAGKPDHKQDNAAMVEHIVELVEARARELEAERRRESMREDAQAAFLPAAE
jgi:(E)-4-hydroxy-3-methylbut-2-enyl-diphosphate synthase